MDTEKIFPPSARHATWRIGEIVVPARTLGYPKRLERRFEGREIKVFQADLDSDGRLDYVVETWPPRFWFFDNNLTFKKSEVYYQDFDHYQSVIYVQLDEDPLLEVIEFTWFHEGGRLMYVIDLDNISWERNGKAQVLPFWEETGALGDDCPDIFFGQCHPAVSSTQGKIVISSPVISRKVVGYDFDSNCIGPMLPILLFKCKGNCPSNFDLEARIDLKNNVENLKSLLANAKSKVEGMRKWTASGHVEGISIEGSHRITTEDSSTFAAPRKECWSEDSVMVLSSAWIVCVEGTSEKWCRKIVGRYPRRYVTSQTGKTLLACSEDGLRLIRKEGRIKWIKLHPFAVYPKCKYCISDETDVVGCIGVDPKEPALLFDMFAKVTKLMLAKSGHAKIEGEVDGEDDECTLWFKANMDEVKRAGGKLINLEEWMDEKERVVKAKEVMY